MAAGGVQTAALGGNSRPSPVAVVPVGVLKRAHIGFKAQTARRFPYLRTWGTSPAGGYRHGLGPRLAPQQAAPVPAGAAFLIVWPELLAKTGRAIRVSGGSFGQRAVCRAETARRGVR